jgi:hypothetical protein
MKDEGGRMKALNPESKPLHFTERIVDEDTKIEWMLIHPSSFSLHP